MNTLGSWFSKIFHSKYVIMTKYSLQYQKAATIQRNPPQYLAALVKLSSLGEAPVQHTLTSPLSAIKLQKLPTSQRSAVC